MLNLKVNDLDDLGMSNPSYQRGKGDCVKKYGDSTIKTCTSSKKTLKVFRNL